MWLTFLLCMIFPDCYDSGFERRQLQVHITKASLLAGVGFPLGMYWGQSLATGSDLSLRNGPPSHSLKWAIHMKGPPPSAGSNPPWSMFFEGVVDGNFFGEKEDGVMDITRLQAPNLVLSHRVDASCPGSCVTWQDAANLTTFWSIWHATVPSHTNAKHDNVVALAVVVEAICSHFFSSVINSDVLPFFLAPPNAFQKRKGRKMAYLCRFWCILQLYLHRVYTDT